MNLSPEATVLMAFFGVVAIVLAVVLFAYKGRGAKAVRVLAASILLVGMVCVGTVKRYA